MKAPKRIYLQVEDEGGRIEEPSDCTWCRDRINDSDIVYVREAKRLRPQGKAKK